MADASHTSFLPPILTFCAGAVLAVPLFRRLGQSAVLGYLAAGIVIGPSVLEVIKDPDTIRGTAEIGVVLLLFLVGLELQPERLYSMRKDILGAGLAQMTLSAGLIGAVAWGFGFSVGGSVAVGLALALSATSIALQLLEERGDGSEAYGRRTFSILLFQDISIAPALALLPLISGVVLVALISPVMLGGLVFSGKSLQPKFSKLNPLPGIKRMFSAQTGAELLKAILKTILVGSVTGFFLWHHWPQMMRLMAESPITAMGNAMDLVGLCALLVVLGVIPMVGFDVFFQIFSHLKKLRMSRQDIRDEFKQSEGDPHVKGRIRQMQRAAARRRMMADVPKADVIVNNPTHYSVALQYDENKMSAPKVVAKGAGLVALRIREIGAENNVPTLEAPPLARALYRHAEIGQQIPGQLYAAVAEVLAWVWQLKRWRLAGGQRPVQPTHLPVPEALDFINEKPTHE